MNDSEVAAIQAEGATSRKVVIEVPEGVELLAVTCFGGEVKEVSIRRDKLEEVDRKIALAAQVGLAIQRSLEEQFGVREIILRRRREAERPE